MKINDCFNFFFFLLHCDEAKFNDRIEPTLVVEYRTRNPFHWESGEVGNAASRREFRFAPS